MMPAPPLLVQAYRGHGGYGFVTDKTFDELTPAVEHAEALFATWGRKVRVIDQNEFVWFEMPQRKQTPRGPRASTLPARDSKPRPLGNRGRRHD
jgi:hypothetical protein